MPRHRIIPDSDVLQTVCRMIAKDGDRAVAFAAVARATGLAAPTLVKRFGSRDGMVHAALLAGWDRLDAETAIAEAQSSMDTKGAIAFLKTLGKLDISVLSAAFRDAAARDRAAAWRTRVEDALSGRLNGDPAILFAAWQGQLLWQSAGGKGFRLKDAVKRLC